jgi:hypothetical protein
MARAIWPFIGKMQDTFFQSQMEAFSSIGSKSSKAAVTYQAGHGSHPFSSHDTLERKYMVE